MDFEEYRETSAATAVYPGTPGSWVAMSYVALGLAGEFGEVANQIKKIIRDDAGKVTDARRERLVSELGDGFWYACRVMDELGIDHKEVFQHNIDKLRKRQAEGTLGGDGEDRSGRKPLAFGLDYGFDGEPIPDLTDAQRERLREIGAEVGSLGISLPGLVAATRAAEEAEKQAVLQRMLGEAVKPADGYYRVKLKSVTLGLWRNHTFVRGFWAQSMDEAARKAVAKFGGTVVDVEGPIELPEENAQRVEKGE